MDKFKIEIMINEIILAAIIELDRNRIREDLYCLYSDIIEEIMIKAPEKEKLIYYYADLLKLEDEAYSPYESYEAGINARLSNKDNSVNQKDSFSFYLGKLEQKNINIISRREIYFIELCSLLGETNDIMSDFTDLYHDCNSIIRNNIKSFFDLGFNTTNI